MAITMIENGNLPAGSSPEPAGQREDSINNGAKVNPAFLSVNGIKNPPTVAPGYFHREDVEFALNEIRAGHSITEESLFNHSQSRYRRAQSRSILKEIARRYPKETSLTLQGGIWILSPVPAVPQ